MAESAVMEPVSPALAQLAEAAGVAISYVDQSGAHVAVAAPTVRAVLASLGHACDNDEAIAASLTAIHERHWRRTLPPVIVGRQGEDRRVLVHVPHGRPVRVRVIAEDGASRELAQAEHWVEPISIDGALIGEAAFVLPGDLPIGWHVVEADADGRVVRSPLAMAPRALDPGAIVGGRQWGFMTQLYATRSAASWAIGDLGDLTALATWSAREHGAGFVLVNPLHAAAPVEPMAPSPYLPVTRRFANPLYLRVEDIPELDRVDGAQRAQITALAQELRALNTDSGLLDRDRSWAAKRIALRMIFEAGLDASRQAEFEQWIAAEGDGVRAFATWCAIADAHGAENRLWPEALRDRTSPEVAAFCAEHDVDITFHLWLQWQVEQQLEHCQRAAKAAGMAIGVMHDLAVGVHPEGADVWSLGDVLATSMSVGCPPDMYNQLGQDWSQPPWRPDALADAAYGPYRDMLRTVLRSAGGLRIDHVLGLFRMWWIPRGQPAKQGTYVRFDHDAMLGILCLEAHRAGAVVVGEDLGTLEGWVQEALADRGILGTVISWFQGDLEPRHWRGSVLASATVHDLPPTAGYLRGEHVRIRAELGLLTRSIDDEARDAAAQRARWESMLKDHGWLDPSADTSTDAGIDAMAIALHRAVGASPAMLVGIGLSDVVGDRRAQNQPGTDREYPNWCVPMTNACGRVVLLEDVMGDGTAVAALVDAVRGRG